MKRVKKIIVDPIYSAIEVEAKMGQSISDADCQKLIDFDADVFCKESGKCIAKFRKKIIPAKVQRNAWTALKDASSKSLARITAGGEFTQDNDVLRFNERRIRRIRQDGKISNTNQGQPVDSGIIGYFDRMPRTPYCRQTAYNRKHLDKFINAYPIIKYVDNLYADLMPDEYKLQRDMADKTSQDFVIHDTAFTTITVNKNWQTSLHTDNGDFKDGFGNLTVLRAGNYTGGHFVLYRWGVGFDLQNGDILLANVHEYHANTPMQFEGNATRLSLVMYYRENMIHCGSADEELERVKKRHKGTPLN